MSEGSIQNVSDTALWVAVYRAQESLRPDALFKDPYAELLAGDRGMKIATTMGGTRYTRWSVVLRTHIIDAFIHSLIDQGVDAVVNLGAGLDTRPYRMNLPPALKWFEVDFPHMIEHKQQHLGREKPVCQLERIAVDLGNDEARSRLLADLASRSQKILVLTEGVVPYLTAEQVTQLANNLSSHPSYRYWILDYFSPKILPYFKSKKRLHQMRNAPFQFTPEDFFGFFSALGWRTHDIRYIGEESLKVGRKVPMPWWAEVVSFIFRIKPKGEHLKFVAYVVMEPS